VTRTAHTVTAEEPVVSKQARVVEEVVVGKESANALRRYATKLQVEHILFVVTTALMSGDIEELVNSFARVTL
jgi:stress response protein YsnF